MSDPVESLEETETRPTTISLESLTRQFREPDLEALTPRSKLIQLSVGELVAQDYSLEEIAESLQQPVSSILGLLNSLRSELALQTGFLPLADGEYEALKASIEEHGIQSPILLGQHYPIIDGTNRWNIAIELGLTEIPVAFVEGKTEEEEHDLILTLNIARRQLGAAQRREIVRSELWRDKNRSDRVIAAVCGVSHPTVAKIRESMKPEWAESDLESQISAVEVTEEEVQEFSGRLAEADQLVNLSSSQKRDEQAEKRVGADGKVRKLPERRPETREEPPAKPYDQFNDPEPVIMAKTKLGSAFCPHGEYLNIFFNGTVYTLESDRD